MIRMMKSISPLNPQFSIARRTWCRAVISASGDRISKARAKSKRGVRFGRPEKDVPDDFAQLVKAWEKKELPLTEMLKKCDMSEATFYRKLRELRLKSQK